MKGLVLASQGPIAVRMAKLAINQGIEVSSDGTYKHYTWTETKIKSESIDDS